MKVSLVIPPMATNFAELKITAGSGHFPCNFYYGDPNYWYQNVQMANQSFILASQTHNLVFRSDLITETCL